MLAKDAPAVNGSIWLCLFFALLCPCVFKTYGLVEHNEAVSAVGIYCVITQALELEMVAWFSLFGLLANQD